VQVNWSPPLLLDARVLLLLLDARMATDDGQRLLLLLLLLLHPFNGLFSRTTWVTGTRKGNHSGFYWSKRMPVASAGPYANHLHLAPDR